MNRRNEFFSMLIVVCTASLTISGCVGDSVISEPIACESPDCQGADGTDGKDGISCWDLSRDHHCDNATEDTNGDGTCDVHDCRGEDADPAERSVERVFFSSESLANTGVLQDRLLPVIKHSEDTSLRVTYYDGMRAVANTPGQDGFCFWEILFDNMPCTDPGPLRGAVYAPPTAGLIGGSQTVIGYCSKANGVSLVDGVEITVAVSNEGANCHTNWAPMNITGFLEAEELQPEP